MLKMKKVVHLIPYDAVGGVETAARTMWHMARGRLQYEVVYVFPNEIAASPRSVLFNPISIFRCVAKMIRDPVDIVVMSLWRSALVGIIYKIIRPNTKIVLFLHNTRDAHFIDWAITRSAAALATEIWADASSTLSTRMPSIKTRGRVISYLPEHIVALPPIGKVTPTFIFWGRLVAQKRLDRALRIFAEIWRSRKDATFTIVGPDGGELAALNDIVSELGIGAAVSFLGPKSIDEIKYIAVGKAFYFQTSDFEGMGLSVVEAMQLGLVPIVTGVGEIGKYCHSGENAIVISSPSQVINEVSVLLSDADRYSCMRDAAIATWSHRQLYSESVLDACESVLALDKR